MRIESLMFVPAAFWLGWWLQPNWDSYVAWAMWKLDVYGAGAYLW